MPRLSGEMLDGPGGDIGRHALTGPKATTTMDCPRDPV